MAPRSSSELSQCQYYHEGNAVIFQGRGFQVQMHSSAIIIFSWEHLQIFMVKTSSKNCKVFTQQPWCAYMQTNTLRYSNIEKSFPLLTCLYIIKSPDTGMCVSKWNEAVVYTQILDICYNLNISKIWTCFITILLLSLIHIKIRCFNWAYFMICYGFQMMI